MIARKTLIIRFPSQEATLAISHCCFNYSLTDHTPKQREIKRRIVLVNISADDNDDFDDVIFNLETLTKNSILKSM